MEERQRLEIAQRIRELRDRSPYTQPQVAEKLGIGLRAYQKLEAHGTTKWERCEELAAIFENTTTRWIWDGTDTAPDLLGQLGGDANERLARIEEALGEVLANQSNLQANQAQVLEGVQGLQRAQQDQQSKRRRGGSGRAASGS